MNASTLLPTPADLKITPRDVRFGSTGATPRWWHNNDPYATALYNALSATFPVGEAFFVESVRAFRDGADPKLLGEIKAFTTQEAIHSREHDAFNHRAIDSGYDLTKLEAQVLKRLAITKAKPPIVSLAATMALEHFTAILAHELLANPKHLAGAEEETANLWRWHAVEEIEHKGVAYDTWLHATRDCTGYRRWKVKSLVMIYITRNFVIDRTAGALELLRQDGITGLRAWAAMLWYMWVAPGMLRKIAGAWFKFFLPRFHPWNEDDRALIAAFEATYPYRQQPPRRRVRTAA
jgi:uncharacterized protein